MALCSEIMEFVIKRHLFFVQLLTVEATRNSHCRR